MINSTNKIIVILGPTSSGKSDVAIKLAKKYNGEIISADSRQIYRGLDIGTGKIEPDRPGEIPQKFTSSKFYAGPQRDKPFISQGIPHYMLDIISPRTIFSAAQFKKRVDKIIPDILKRGKLPIICGGTGFWIKSIVDNVNYPSAKPDWKLRNKLRNKSAKELFALLKKLDSKRARSIDQNNPARLIRAIEICKALGKVPRPLTPSPASGRGWIERTRNPGEGESHSFLQIGLKLPQEKLYANIKKRLAKRFEAGMIEEVEKLHYEDRLSWKKIESFGLGYKLIPSYLRGEIKSREELFEKIYQAEKDYAKRQMTWFRKDKRIKWIASYQKIKNEVKKFLT